jgi:hypothetical protein
VRRSLAISEGIEIRSRRLSANAGQCHIGLQRARRISGGVARRRCLNLVVTGSGQFRARLTQVTLHHLRLSAGNERVSRIAFAAVPEDTFFVSLHLGDRAALTLDGMQMGVDEMITLGPGQRVHARTNGRCRWGAIRLSAEELAQ